MSNQSDLAKSAAGFNGDPLSIDTANNRVGVGTTSPSNPITIDAANALGSTFTGTTAGEGIRVRQTSYTADNYVSLIEAPYVNTASAPSVRIGAKFSGGGSSLAFGTTNNYGNGITNTAMTIDSSGKLLAGTTSTFDNVSFLLAQILGGLATKINTTASTTQISFFNPNGRVGFIGTSGTTTSYNTSSDYRLKENVTDVTDGITRVKQLEPKRFNFIADRTVDGFLAHEAQTAVPEAVTGTHNEVDDDGNAVMQGIDQSKLVPLLTAALKESIAKIEALEARVTALEAE
jgi:hypothetical protein